MQLNNMFNCIWSSMVFTMQKNIFATVKCTVVEFMSYIRHLFYNPKELLKRHLITIVNICIWLQNYSSITHNKI